ncbi:MAG: hypothetical protein RJA44_1232 [Pseudomonadota bacterium]
MKKILLCSGPQAPQDQPHLLQAVQALLEGDTPVTLLLLSERPWPDLHCAGSSTLQQCNRQGDEAWPGAALIDQVVAFEPDLVLVDRAPLGASGELAGLLQRLRRSPRMPACMLLLADLPDPAPQGPADWRDRRLHQTLRDHYDRILVLGDARVRDLAQEYAWPISSAEKTHYAGYLRHTSGHAPIAAPVRPFSRAGAGTGSPSLILLWLQPDSDAPAVVETCNKALLRAGWRDTRIMVAADPYTLRQLRESGPATTGRAGLLDLSPASPQLDELLGTADVVISGARYDQVSRLLGLRKRAILVPRPRPFHDEPMRAESLQDLGLMQAIHPDLLTPGALLARMQELMRQPHSPMRSSAIGTDGATQLREHVLELIEGARRRNGRAEQPARHGLQAGSLAA